MDEFHRIPYFGHPGYQKMITTTRKLYYWSGMKKYIYGHISKCLECQHVKVEHKHPAGMLQTFPIMEWKWEVITIYFIIGLTRKTKQNDSIMVVVDKLRQLTLFR
jgi:hypothetical protein